MFGGGGGIGVGTICSGSEPAGLLPHLARYRITVCLRACHTVTSLATSCGKLITRHNHVVEKSKRCRLLPYIVAISRILSWCAYEIFKRFKNLATTRRPKWAELFSY